MNVFHPNKALELSLALILLFIAPCLKAGDSAVIAAASSIKFALKDIAESFYMETGKRVHISYSSSGNLTRQIQQGGPFELFFSANRGYVDLLYQQKKTLGKGINYALGRLVLITPKDSSLPLDKQLDGLKKALQKGDLQHVAIANPKHAPYGVAAQEVLQKQGLWTLIKPYLVLGENIAQTAQFTVSGAAQVGLISYSLSQAPGVKNKTRSLLIPASLHKPIKQSMVLLKNAGETAKLFFDYIQQDAARSILSSYGYTGF